MPAIFLSEQDVSDLIDMQRSIEVVEEAFQELAAGRVQNVPRSRVAAPGVLLHSMSASAEYLGLVGWKTYTTTREKMQFFVGASDIETGELRVLIQADLLGQLRTGAATGVATKYLSRDDSARVGLIGTGLQARTQLLAVCSVRPVSHIEVFGRDVERRHSFAREMTERCGIEVTAVDSSDQAIVDKDVILTATTSLTPVFEGARVAPGVHINAVGSNFLQKSELDEETIGRCGTIVCDSIEQCRLEAGDFVEALQSGTTGWDQMTELSDVVAGKHPGRKTESETTLFKSVGLALEDVAMAGELLRRAEQQGRGVTLPF